MEKKSTNDIIATIVKILFALAAVGAAVYAGIKIYERIKFKRECELCDCCCDEDYFDEEDLGELDCQDEEAETIEEVTEAELNVTEE